MSIRAMENTPEYFYAENLDQSQFGTLNFPS